MSFDPKFVELTADVLKIYLQEKVRHRKSVVQYAAPCPWYVVEKTGFTTKRCASATFHHLFYALWLAVNLEHYQWRHQGVQISVRTSMIRRFLFSRDTNYRERFVAQARIVASRRGQKMLKYSREKNEAASYRSREGGEGPA